MLMCPDMKKTSTILLASLKSFKLPPDLYADIFRL